MSWIGRFLGIFLILGFWVEAPAAADTSPVKGAFVTLEKASGGMLKYSSTAADGTFLIEDLPNGRYRMSITSPASDRGADYPRDVLGAFNGLTVESWGKRSRAKAEAGGSELYESGVLIKGDQWTSGATWLDVKVTNRTVSGKFTYQDLD